MGIIEFRRCVRGECVCVCGWENEVSFGRMRRAGWMCWWSGVEWSGEWRNG